MTIIYNVNGKTATTQNYSRLQSNEADALKHWLKLVIGEDLQKNKIRFIKPYVNQEDKEELNTVLGILRNRVYGNQFTKQQPLDS